MRAAIYARSADLDEAAIAGQLERCRGWAAEHDLEVVAEAIDNGSSGLEVGENLRRLVEADDRKWATLLVTRWDRLARDQVVLSVIMGRLSAMHVDIVTVLEEG
jgi:DNA invertase Pin-like site-specific DNA recombinase